MNIQEIEQKVQDRIQARKPIFEALYPKREVEFEVFSHFGRTFMGLLIEERGFEPKKVRDFVLNGIRQIDPGLRADLVPDRDSREMRATLQLGMQEIGERFPDLLFTALQVEWTRVDQE